MAEVNKTTAVNGRMVADRWTQNLAKAGWTPVSVFFLDNYHRLTPPLKYSEAMFIIHIMRYKWDKAAPYPGFKGVAKKMGLSAEGARLLARNLEKKGYLYRQMRVGQTNRFHFDNLFAALEKLMAADKMAAATNGPDVIATAIVDGKEVKVKFGSLLSASELARVEQVRRDDVVGEVRHGVDGTIFTKMSETELAQLQAGKK